MLTMRMLAILRIGSNGPRVLEDSAERNTTLRSNSILQCLLEITVVGMIGSFNWVGNVPRDRKRSKENDIEIGLARARTLNKYFACVVSPLITRLIRYCPEPEEEESFNSSHCMQRFLLLR